VQLNKQKL